MTTNSTVEVATTDNPWGRQRHSCYFCAPDNYPPMPKGHTLCARCGALIITPGTDDPHNLAMTVCPPCDADIEASLADAPSTRN